MNDYYVYEHIRKDTNQCFYVGKGRGKRAYYELRNPKHDEIANKYGMIVKIINSNLSEEEALEMERKTILHYVFDLNYGIDILGYNNKNNKNGFLTNRTFGGEGVSGSKHTEEWCKQHSKDMSGDKNPMYGVNLWKIYSEEKANEIKNKISKKVSGKNNSMYGVSPKERMDEETYSQWLQKTQERLINQTGENNPNYGNKTLHNKLEKNPELRKIYYSRPGSQNGRARKVELYDLNKNYINEFLTIGDAVQWIKEQKNSKSNINSMRSNLSHAIKNNKPYLGFYGKFK